MTAFSMKVFDVQRGLCVYLRTPNNYAVMIDCGRSDARSPAGWIAKNEAPSLTHFNGKALAWLIVTHPHDDHVEDIDTIRTALPPAILTREKDHNWTEILNPPDGDPSENVKTFKEWQEAYNQPVETWPNFGVEFKQFALSPAEAAAVSAANQNLLNNSSRVLVVNFSTPKGTFKTVIAGDNETAGWQALLKKSAFKAAVKGAHFFITSHHGHESGYCKELFDAMGTPLINITSERSGDESVHDYSADAKGMTFRGQVRKHFTTRSDGDVTIAMKDTWEYDVTTSN